MAEGPAFAGCPTGVCEQTLFGCCDDGETPASALPKAKRRRRRQAEESGYGKDYCNEDLQSQDYLKGDGDEASGADDAEASGDDKEDGDDGSGDATEEGEDGEDETKCEENKKCQNGKFGNYPDNPLILQISPGCCPDGRTHSQGPKKQGCFECPEVGWSSQNDCELSFFFRKCSCVTNVRKPCTAVVLIFKTLQQVFTSSPSSPASSLVQIFFLRP